MLRLSLSLDIEPKSEGEYFVEALRRIVTGDATNQQIRIVVQQIKASCETLTIADMATVSLTGANR